MNNIGDKIVKYRARNRISQRRFAEMSGVSVPTIKLLEHGERCVRATTIVKIMDVIEPDSKEESKK